MKSLLDELMLPSSNRQLNKEVATIGKVPNDAAGIIAASDPRAWRQALSAQWETLQEVFGEGYVYPFINNVLKPLTQTLNAISQWGSANPVLMKNIADGFVILGGALVGGGGVAILSALGPVGWLASGIIAAGAAMALYKNPIMTWLESVRNTNWNEEITKALMPAITAIKEWFSTLGATIIESLKGMWANMKGALGSLFHINFEGGGFGGGSGLTNAAWGGGGGGVSAARGFTGDAGGMQPYFKTRLDSLLADANASGHPLSIASGYRSQAHQNALFAASDHSGHWVARHSHHTMGIAADLRGDLAWAHAHAAQHGLRFPMPWEKWHIEPSGGRPAHMPPGGRGGETHVHNNIYMDGKKIASNTVKHLVRSAQYPTSVGRQDGRGVFMSPGAEVFA